MDTTVKIITLNKLISSFRFAILLRMLHVHTMFYYSFDGEEKRYVVFTTGYNCHDVKGPILKIPCNI